MDICYRCGGEVIGTYKQFYKQDINGHSNGDVDVRVEFKCNKCGEIW